jgi:hypothetical protein
LGVIFGKKGTVLVIDSLFYGSKSNEKYFEALADVMKAKGFEGDPKFMAVEVIFLNFWLFSFLTFNLLDAATDK